MAVMIEHAVGVVSLERFAEISHMDHDEMGSLLLDTIAENNKLRELVRSVLVLRHDPVYKWLDAATAEVCGKSFTEQARELGIEDR